MLIQSSSPSGALPRHVGRRLDPDERHVATLKGLLESGLAVTDSRLLAWRANGIGSPLPLRSIDRILVDAGAIRRHVAVIVVPRYAVQAPVVLLLRSNQLANALGFVEHLRKQVLALADVDAGDPEAAPTSHYGRITCVEFQAPSTEAFVDVADSGPRSRPE